MKVIPQKGSAYLLTIFFVLLFGILAVAIGMTGSQSSFLQNLNTQMVAAQNAADAGAKIAILQSYNQIYTYASAGQSAAAANLAFHEIDPAASPMALITGGNARYLYQVKYWYIDNVTHTRTHNASPYTTATIPNTIEILACGIVTANSRTYYRYAKVQVDIQKTIENTHNFLDFFGSATYSGGAWMPDNSTTPPSLIPPDEGHNVVMLNGLKVQSGVQKDFNCALSNYDPSSFINGYGIYYGMTNTAANPEGYIVHFDPGAKMKLDLATNTCSPVTLSGVQVYAPHGQFLVKRTIKHGTTPVQPGRNEWDDANSRFYYDDPANKTDAGIPLQPTTIAIPLTYPGESFDSQLQDPNNDITAVPLEFLQSLLEAKTSVTYSSLDDFIRARHIISITVIEDSTGTEPPTHVIKCDGVPVLHFKDRTSKCINSFANTCYGIRVWLCDSRYYNVDAGFALDNIKWLRYDYTNRTTDDIIPGY